MRVWVITALVLLAVGLYAAWFYSTHEKVSASEFVGFQGEARYNRFLAAQMLLEDLGIAAESMTARQPSEWLPPHDDTLVVSRAADFGDEYETELIAEWVVRGGHLVVLPRPGRGRDVDLLLQRYGYTLVEAPPWEPDAKEAEDEPDEEADDGYDYRVDLSATSHRLAPLGTEEAAVFLSDEHGLIAARRPYGNGFVTLLAASFYFHSDALQDADHARLLLDVVAGYLSPGKVWFVYDGGFPPLWAVLWRSAPLVIVAMALLLALWLWMVIPRFGPRIDPPAEARRSINEHVTAAGRFVCRHHGTRALTDAAVAALLRAAERRHPGMSQMPARRQAAILARMSGMSEEAVAELLGSGDEPGHRAFTHYMQRVKSISDAL